MKLLLDEQYSPRIAEELRRRGHDVQSVSERPDLRGAGDLELWNRARGEGRALLTENVADFMALVNESVVQGDHHFGVVFTSARSLPRSAATIGVYVELLDEFLRDRPAEDALADMLHWLSRMV